MVVSTTTEKRTCVCVCVCVCGRDAVCRRHEIIVILGTGVTGRPTDGLGYPCETDVITDRNSQPVCIPIYLYYQVSIIKGH